MKDVTAKIHVDPKATPRFDKARPVPFALQAGVEEELERLQKQGIIEPIQFSDWAAPIVPVVKSDGKIRICGDYAYQQLKLNDESRQYVTINTHKGLFTYNRLPIGISSAPLIFQ